MNLRERGFTVGDLILILIVTLISFVVINQIKDSKTQKQISSIHQLEIERKY